jgi:hypothetical protein
LTITQLITYYPNGGRESSPFRAGRMSIRKLAKVFNIIEKQSISTEKCTRIVLSLLLERVLNVGKIALSKIGIKIIVVRTVEPDRGSDGFRLNTLHVTEANASESRPDAIH